MIKVQLIVTGSISFLASKNFIPIFEANKIEYLMGIREQEKEKYSLPMQRQKNTYPLGSQSGMSLAFSSSLLNEYLVPIKIQKICNHLAIFVYKKNFFEKGTSISLELVKPRVRATAERTMIIAKEYHCERKKGGKADFWYGGSRFYGNLSWS